LVERIRGVSGRKVVVMVLDGGGGRVTDSSYFCGGSVI
jgi:hypothetical protein